MFCAFNLPRLNLHIQIALVLLLTTPLIPGKLRFSNYRRWMWSAFLLWWTAFGLGCLLYYRSYVNP
jgi:hypothetical protein